MSLLPAGGRFYLWADTVIGRPLLDALSLDLLDNRRVVQMLDSTGTAAAVVFAEGEDRRFFLAATGNYPRHRANFSFALFSRDLKRQRGSGGNSYWFSRSNNFTLSMGSNLLLVSDADPFGDFEREVQPPAFAEFHRGQVMAGWLNNPSETINSLLATMGVPLNIPAEDFFFGATRLPASGSDAGGSITAPWELAFRIRTPSASHARSLLSFFSVASIFVQRAPGEGPSFAGRDSISPQEAASLLFSSMPQVDGEFLTLRIGSLDENSIALLFNMFSVYSR